jgi:hypothetical protein
VTHLSRVFPTSQIIIFCLLNIALLHYLFDTAALLQQAVLVDCLQILHLQYCMSSILPVYFCTYFHEVLIQVYDFWGRKMLCLNQPTFRLELVIVEVAKC